MAGDFGDIMKEKFIANKSYSAVSAISAAAWGLGYFGMPHILIRFMGIRSNSEIKLSRRIATVWVITAFVGAVVVGSAGTAYLSGVLAPEMAETVFSASMQHMYPTFVAGIFLCAILAAAMSTADSQLLVASSAFSRDVYKGLLKKDAKESEVLNVSRITVFVIAAVAFVIALNPKSSIFSLVSYAWAGFGATFGPLILLALFWRNMTRNGALAGLVAGGVTVIAWHNLKGGVFNIYEILPGFFACAVFAVVFSLLQKDKDAEMLTKFDEYRKMAD